MRSRIAIALAFLLVLALPFLVQALFPSDIARAAGMPRERGGGEPLIIVTPHVEQIRLEFSAAFDRWHRRHHGGPAAIDWRTPGGTSEIIKQLEAQFEAMIRDGKIDSAGRAEAGSASFDLFFGGGSYEHGKMKQVRSGAGPAGKVEYRMGQPAGFPAERLREWFGPVNKIGAQTLYDPDQYWIGTALSSFGIVYNKDLLRERSLPEPGAFTDLCDPRYQNALILADPRLSGSITTAFDSILNKQGWDSGWRTLREMCANTRSFAAASTRPPIDVSQGEAAAGLAIDFYGRGQAQFTLRPGQDPATARVGYVDPAGAVYIDADPVSMLNGAPHADLARRFIEFCLSDEGQCLWQLPPRESAAGKANPKSADGEPLGPEREALRRMPVRPDVYARYGSAFVDRVNPFELASELPIRGWRGAIGPLMSAFGIDVLPDLREAWRGLNLCRAAVASGRVSEDVVHRLEADFYAWPEHRLKDGSTLAFTEANFKAIAADADGFKNTAHAKRTQIAYTEFFRGRFRKVAADARAALGGRE